MTLHWRRSRVLFISTLLLFLLGTVYLIHKHQTSPAPLPRLIVDDSSTTIKHKTEPIRSEYVARSDQVDVEARVTDRQSDIADIVDMKPVVVDDHQLSTFGPDPSAPQVLWISKLDSDDVARGFMQENVNFIVPLERYIHIGWWPGGTQLELDSNSVYLGVPSEDRRALDEAFTRGDVMYNRVLAKGSKKVITMLSEQPFDYDKRFSNDGSRLQQSRYMVTIFL
eukprot:sb/3469707/